MDPFKLFNPDYLFDASPNTAFALFWVVIVVLLLVFASSWRVQSWLHKQSNYKALRPFLGGIPSRMREFASVGLILAFVRKENIPYLSMRLWMVLLGLTAIVYAAYIWRNYELKFETQSKQAQTKSDKYRPTPKRKKKKRR